jgi:DNA-directed RNA polymerase subunit K/omega
MRQKLPRGTGSNSEMLDRLSKRFGKYALVVGVSKRAHDLKERVHSPLESSSRGIVNRAIEEIANGRVKIRGAEPEEDSE